MALDRPTPILLAVDTDRLSGSLVGVYVVVVTLVLYQAEKL